MNIITHDKAYSFFPNTTFEERRTVRYFKRSDTTRALAVQKYIRRGWDVVDPSDLRNQVSNEFPFGRRYRYVGDRACWTLPVHPALDLPHGFVEANSWSISSSRSDMNTTILAIRGLKHRYTLSPTENTFVRLRIWEHELVFNMSSDGKRYVYDSRPRRDVVR